MARRHLGAAEIRELLGVHLHRQTEIVRRIEQMFGLGDVERDVLAKHVDRIDQSLVMQRRQPVFDDDVDVFIRATRKLRGQGVRRQEGRLDGHRISLGELTGSAKHFSFVRQSESVPGLDLDCGDTLGQQRLQTRSALIDQLLQRSVAYRTHR